MANVDPDVLRILVATDNHLGYMERDPVRGMDSFAAFEEVLLLAKQNKVDFVLLGGDLFHDNKPSRRTLYRTMDILRRHCMGDDSVSFQIISEQAENFKDRFGHVNYEDPYFSVGLPIFSIHGNHDDPTREGGVEALAALDLLHVANLVNYFGKSSKVDDVEVNPILMGKGDTRVALYGMGSMRDERLNRMWQQKKVKFLRPLEDDGGKDFFNVFVLHQNRDLGRGKKNCIHESMIPEWMDLVVWGHEHECQIDPMESLVGTFRICQPGSSVATSLVEGESVPKHAGLLEIRRNDFRMLSHKLSQVRPFRMGEIVLNQVEGLDSKSANVDEAVGEVLARRVVEMVNELRQEEALDPPEPPEGQEYLVAKRDQVLVRLRVEHSDFPTLNNQRFGSQFMGKVANPSDLLLFYRRRASGGAGGDGLCSGLKGKGGGGGLWDPVRPDSLDEVRVEDLVMHNLETSDKKLSLLVEPRLKLALEDYVYKGDAQAVNDLVKETLEGAQRLLKREKAAGNAAMIDDAVAKMSEKERAKMEADKERVARLSTVTSRTREDRVIGSMGDAGGRALVAGAEGDKGAMSMDEDVLSEDGSNGYGWGGGRGAGTARRGGISKRVGNSDLEDDMDRDMDSDGGGRRGGQGGRGREKGSVGVRNRGGSVGGKRGGAVGIRTKATSMSSAAARKRSAVQAGIYRDDERSSDSDGGANYEDQIQDDSDDAPTVHSRSGGGRGRGKRIEPTKRSRLAKGGQQLDGARKGSGVRGVVASARGSNRATRHARVSYREDGSDCSEVDEAEVLEVVDSDDDESFHPQVGESAGGQSLLDDDYDEEDVEEDVGARQGKGKGRAKATKSKPPAKVKAAAPRSRAGLGALAARRAKVRSAGPSQSQSEGLQPTPAERKRQLPSWVTSSASRRNEESGDEDNVASAVSSWR